ncbi:glycosyltransferase [Carnobacterium maltaromaticum]|uniref:glycosyltransferase n=1 Tax=Carnobacterium maltaromaticum TaxID=2751 RepID=UPI00165AC5DE|nr:glycosyltransferase [Carnobacterium maltaromaticum]MBC9810748.1 glycosyltransferase [Carnobacterium maltaromaticum]
MNFVTLFLPTENFHLTKDVGMIPYIMYKYYGYNSTIVSYDNGDYPYLKTEVRGLKQDFVRKTTNNNMLNGCLYIWKEARNIDVLHLFHIGIQQYIWLLLFKLRNSKGKVYLKLDAAESIREIKFNRWNIKHFFKKYALKKCDLISVETTQLAEYLSENWPVEITYITNGFYDQGKYSKINYDMKQNTICHVSRVGSPEKATDVLLKGFKIASPNIKDWNLKIVGPIEKEFEPFIEQFFADNPELKERIEFVGLVTDRKELNQYYEQSKVFIMTSLFESFGLVFVEALRYGCTIITSNVSSAIDITDKERVGKIFPINDAEILAEKLITICSDENYLKQNTLDSQEYAYANFYWPTLCGEINKKLK